MIAKIKHSSYRVRLASLILVFLVSRATGQYSQALCRLLRIAVTLCGNPYSFRSIKRHYTLLLVPFNAAETVILLAIQSQLFAVDFGSPIVFF